MIPSRLYRNNLDSIPNNSITNKVIVLDLDETLVHTFDGINDYKNLGIDKQIDLRRRSFILNLDDPVDAKGRGIVDQFWGIRRPHLQEFLIFCFSYFKMVIVWSAGIERYVQAIVDEIFKDIQYPHLVYARGKCITDNRARNHKPLRNMISDVPGLNKYMSLNNTLAIDDKTSTYIDNPNNGIKIPIYEPKRNLNSLRSDDIALLQLKQWLLNPHVKSSPDVRSLDKTTIFETPLQKQSSIISDSDSSISSSIQEKDMKRLTEAMKDLGITVRA